MGGTPAAPIPAFRGSAHSQSCPWDFSSGLLQQVLLASPPEKHLDISTVAKCGCMGSKRCHIFHTCSTHHCCTSCICCQGVSGCNSKCWLSLLKLSKSWAKFSSPWTILSPLFSPHPIWPGRLHVLGVPSAKECRVAGTRRCGFPGVDLNTSGLAGMLHAGHFTMAREYNFVFQKFNAMFL